MQETQSPERFRKRGGDNKTSTCEKFGLRRALLLAPQTPVFVREEKCFIATRSEEIEQTKRRDCTVERAEHSLPYLQIRREDRQTEREGLQKNGVKYA